MHHSHPFLRNKVPLREVDRIGAISIESCQPILEYAVPLLAQEPCPPCEGTGVVMVAGGRYLRDAWASIKKLREVCDLPVQIWHLGQGEASDQDRRNFEDLDVSFVDAYRFLDEHPAYSFGGWQCKSYAVAYCPFQHVLLLDADCYPKMDPELIFQSPEYASTGVLMWPDMNRCRDGEMVFPCMGIKMPETFQEMEVGQLLIDKKRLWQAVRLTVWMNSHSECFYKLLYGDKDTWQMAMRKLGVQFPVGEPPQWHGYGMIHTFRGEPAFCHYMQIKRSSLIPPDNLEELFREYDQLNQPSYAQ